MTTTSGSSIISALGAGSGVDFIKLAADISAATFAAKRDQLTARKSTLEAQISAVSQLRGAITGLASALGDRVRTGDLAARPQLANPAVAQVTVPAGLSPSGNFSLEVTQLAQSQTLLSRPLASAADLVGQGTLTLRFGTIASTTTGGATTTTFTPDGAQAAIDITVTDTDTLASLATKITSASNGAVTAYVATGTGGAQLVMKGREGAASGFVLEATGQGGGAAAGDLEYFGWSPAGDTGLLRQTARDATFRIDTVEMTSPTNRVTGLPGGFALNLTATNTGAPTTLSFGNNTAAVSGVMNDFVSALNDIVGQLNDLAAPVGGELGNDPGARELRRDLAGLAGRVVMPGATGTEPRTLGDLGLAVNRDGTFRLDTARLNRSLETNPEAVAAMFTVGINGVFSTMDRFARENSLITDPGSLGGSLKRYETQMASSDDRLARIAEEQEALRLRLTRDFTASERRVAASQSTLQFLRQQVDIWSARDR
ncbi:flagellar filament capping protein FliD [Erythrobacter sp. WG]|uniref:flagellar filament capping protein FliD n=1 Tax=Erythrobacter sp. WG TaxID=2985510 RepID=UPI00226E1661|nr:flagellar filament capping protein FliD [Erythrobacter sp. WG]MCX9148856.1 flagellar filament capping protein FliD [Erythrobacter sp. WG]